MPKPLKGTKRTKGTRKRRAVTVTARSGRRFRISGLTSAAGDKWIKVRCDGWAAYAPYRDFRGNGHDAIRRLSDHGVVLIGSECATVRDAVPKIKRFPPRTLIERPGHSGKHFALPSGQVFSPEGSSTPIVLFTPATNKCGSAGGGKAWFNGVCKPLAGQMLCEFMMTATLAPPLLPFTTRIGNFGFELVGDGGVGKSTLQYLMATVVGPGVPGVGGHYWIDFNTTANALEKTMITYADQPLIMDEAATFAGGEGKRSRSDKWRELVFRLAAGSSKARFSMSEQAEHRFIFFSSSNKSLYDVMSSANSAELEAARDRLITLRIDKDDRPFGVFDFIPSEFDNASAFADALKQAASRNFGHAYPRFAQLLVRRQADDPAGLREEIQRWIDEFRSTTGVNLDDGSDTRVADAFGLVYAAGQLAKEAKVLPNLFDSLKASVMALNIHRRDRRLRWRLRLRERLINLSETKGVNDLDDGLPKLSNIEMQGPRIFLHTNRKRCREILFNDAARDLYFPDLAELRKDPENSRWFRSDGDRATVRRKVCRGRGKEPVLAFMLPSKNCDDSDLDD